MDAAEARKLEGNDAIGKGDFERAYRCYSEAIELVGAPPPDHARRNVSIYYSNRAAALLGLGRFVEALADAENALVVDATYLKAKTRQAAALMSLHRMKEAAVVWRAVLDAEPGNNAAKEQLAVCELPAREPFTCPVWKGDGLPPLLPYSPPWLHDPENETAVREVLTKAQQAQLSHADCGELLEGARLQHVQSVAYKLFNQRMREQAENKIDYDTFKKLTWETGWMMSMGPPNNRSVKLSAEKWRNQWHKSGDLMANPRTDADWRCPCATMEVACEECGTLTGSMCICEEAFCSEKCLKKAWPHHKTVCKEIHATNEFGQTVHALSFGL